MKRFGQWLGGCAAAALIASGCQHRAMLPSEVVYTPDAIHEGAMGERPIRFALTAAFISEAGVGVYEKLIRYIEKQTGYPCELVSGFSYRTVSRMLESGAVEVGFIGGLPYVLAQEQPNPPVRLVAAPMPADPRYRGKPVYYSDIIVRTDSPYQRIEDLRGRTWAYNDELSNSGYNLPRAFLIRKGLHKGFLGRMIRTGSHEESIRAVATGQADVSAVDSLVLDYERARGSNYARRVRVIHSLGPSGIVPVVASCRMASERFQTVQRALLEMHKDLEGVAILKEARLKAFVPASDTLYDDIRRALQTARRAHCEGLQQ